MLMIIESRESELSSPPLFDRNVLKSPKHQNKKSTNSITLLCSHDTNFESVLTKQKIRKKWIKSSAPPVTCTHSFFFIRTYFIRILRLKLAKF